MPRIVYGKSVDEAVAELELLHTSRSLNQLVDELRQRWQNRLADGSASAQRVVRGQGKRGLLRERGR